MCERQAIQIPENIINILKQCINAKQCFNAKMFKKLSSQDNNITSWFERNDISPSYIFRIIVKENKTEYARPTCSVCGKSLSQQQILAGTTHCSPQCAYKDSLVYQKVKESTFAKYGVYSTNQLDSVKQKKKETSMKHYGVESPMKSQVVKDILKNTFEEKYGVSNPSYNPEVIVKRRMTNIRHWGVPCAFQNEEVHKKSVETLIREYGVDHPSKSEIIKKKKKETSIAHFGVDSPMKCTEIVNKMLDTRAQNHNEEELALIYDSILKGRRAAYYDTYKQLLEEKGITLLSGIDEYTAIKSITAKCERCGTIFTYTGDNVKAAQKTYCPTCKTRHISEGEREIYAFIKTLIDESLIETCNRSILNGMEIDIYIQSKNIAFEYNGDYWHSTKHGKDKLYHFNKSKGCMDKGIRLVHIFEWEWRTKRNKVENLIKTSLGIYDRKIYARKCTIKPVPSADYIEFTDAYHFNGSAPASIRYGMYYNDELVSVVGFGKSRFSKDNFELIRYCVKNDTMIVGGFSKFLSKIDFEFVSYIDFAHFSGESYFRNGFKFMKFTTPNYWWISYNNIYSRYQTQKHKLGDLIENFDKSISESKNMENNGFFKVYDSGNIKVSWSPKALS